ncbi:ubiquitin carboxyl-terminal hydrolase CYLD isoform X1 [Scyliorhinus canicula]|uniref:ubiquitin carboxyl-terminal hydrolase CYLD isoform X1 n=2 Tax=Scyliorhinus canicula TaxID=7830 RepID=UPI0018F5AC12|nr:ubiquitin carboxyl-terminal hydrolase CYLD isoform X1 [Scyliorhinus canicula]XP_038659535.1 ubiquitin carboxyl-terminal hydrolase CYLD isoform X1 [Scyliorhinus canicula]XP_038659536.1 ubiquitin carboxyl-terminal hydrolase CYLD isoform X1 [Scyliorhinus canicula]XP_038659537.1 ubiquitin carboxyl-terminal hydrolase CYLD isoform X1 [Scyliorhinus canicula]XP_038659538.1 ubiquitin carboxyl-terminal hydrolase CYLD isoform X1 [Scyliorhinus canicula]XP_038659539.1 ubiquitin carboxyl-terminal hydrola
MIQMFLSLELPTIRMRGIEKDKHYFIVMKEFTDNKKKILKGSMGYFTMSETEELSAVVEQCKKTMKVKKEHLKEISKDEAELLLEIQDTYRRCELIQDEKLFKSISNLQINDIVEVRGKPRSCVGIVKNIKNSTRENGLKLQGSLFQVELVEGQDHKLKGKKNIKELSIHAGDIIFTSNTEVEPTRTNDKESKLYNDDEKHWNKSPVGSPPQQVGLPSRRMGRETSNDVSTPHLPSGATSDHSKNSNHYTLKTFPPGMSTPSSPDAEPAESENPALEVESMVEVKLHNNAIVYGVIRWIGTPEGYCNRWAGIELDYELNDANDGTFEKNRYFNCEQNKAIFIPLRNCKPDARFCSNAPKEIPGSPLHAPGKTAADYLTVKEDVPPVREDEALQLMKGRMKGIQGHYNSCYLDSTIFSLFTFTSVLDSILHMPGGQDEKIQRVLREDIVNPLRKTGVVNADKVTELRKLLGCDTFISAEKDPEEFINVLLHEVLAVDPLLKIRAGQKIQESYCYQIILEKDEKLNVPTVQLLLERSFLSCDLKFEEIPLCLLVQMPRFGKQFKMFTKIMPSLELDITDLLNNALRQCFICGEVAEIECAQCLLDPTLNPGAIKQYCYVCNNQVHSHKERKDHQFRKFPYPRDVSVQSPFPRHKMELFAVLCIETSHYVSFVKYGPGKDSWLFFDSMADRIGEENIPEITDCPQIGDYLLMSEDKLAYTDLKQLDGFAKRLFCDAYMCMYQSPRMCLYK